MSKVEQAVWRRLGTAIFNAAAFSIWQISQLGALSDVPMAREIGWAAAVVWGISLVVLFAWTIGAWRARSRGHIDDERVGRNAVNGMAIAYWCVVVGLIVLAPIALVFDLAMLDLLRLLCVVIVYAPAVSIAMLEARDGAVRA